MKKVIFFWFKSFMCKHWQLGPKLWVYLLLVNVVFVLLILFFISYNWFGIFFLVWTLVYFLIMYFISYLIIEKIPFSAWMGWSTNLWDYRTKE